MAATLSVGRVRRLIEEARSATPGLRKLNLLLHLHRLTKSQPSMPPDVLAAIDDLLSVPPGSHDQMRRRAVTLLFDGEEIDDHDTADWD